MSSPTLSGGSSSGNCSTSPTNPSANCLPLASRTGAGTECNIRRVPHRFCRAVTAGLHRAHLLRWGGKVHLVSGGHSLGHPPRTSSGGLIIRRRHPAVLQTAFNCSCGGVIPSWRLLDTGAAVYFSTPSDDYHRTGYTKTPRRRCNADAMTVSPRRSCNEMRFARQRGDGAG